MSNYKTKPFDYQLDAIQYGLNHDKWLLLDEPGLGKTLTTIYIAQEIKKRDNIKHCLIVCGVNTLKTNWIREIEKHSNLSCRILGQKINKKGNIEIGSIKDRLEELKKPIKEFFVVTNIETLRDDNIVKQINSGKNEFDMIVLDECHKVKSPSATQSKNFLKLKNAKYKIGLTGTLILNNPLDCYMPLKWIGAENSTYTNFKYYYCTFSGPFHNILSGFKNLAILKEQLNECSLRRTKDILDLPEKTIVNEYVDMSDTQRRFYNNVKEGIIKEPKVDLKPNVLLSMVSRLRQATACPSILTEEKIESSKIERALDIAEETISNNNKIVIFSTFKETANILFDRLKDDGAVLCTGDIKDSVIAENIQKFQNEDNCKVFIATHQKCGTGITITAANTMVFIDTPWT